jgi:hypothetical protein
MELTFTEMDDLDFLGSNDLTNDLMNHEDDSDSYATYFDKPREINKRQQIIVQKQTMHAQKQTTTAQKQPTTTRQKQPMHAQNPPPPPTNTHMQKSALKKPAISFDDILNNMNLTLMDGKLVFAPPPNKKNVRFLDKNLDKNLEERNNYPLNPLTKEQIFKKKLIDYVNYRNEMIMASKIKSTRLQFTNNNNPNIHTRQTAAFNRIFALKK